MRSSIFLCTLWLDLVLSDPAVASPPVRPVALWGNPFKSKSATPRVTPKAPPPPVSPEQSPKRIIGFYATYTAYPPLNYTLNLVPTDRITHLKYAFIAINPKTNILMLADKYMDKEAEYQERIENDQGYGRCDCCATGTLNQLWEIRRGNPHLKTLMSVGGWSASTYFSDVMATEEARWSFARSCVQFMLDYGFDGIDIDWEYPVKGGEVGIHNRPNDTENLILFFKIVRILFSEIQHLPPVADTWLLTFDTACLPIRYLPNKEIVQALAAELDWINVMCYEFSLSNLKVTQHNAQMYPPEGKKQANTDRGIQWFLEMGVSRDKIVLGMPLYGRAYYDTEPGPARNGVAQPFHGPRGEYISYYPEILTGINNGSYTAAYDLLANAASMYNPTSRTFISYDDMHTARAKLDYIIAQNLGGVMVWDLASDDPSPTNSVLYLARRMLPNVDNSQNKAVRFVPVSAFCNIHGTVKLKQLASLYGGSGKGKYAEWSNARRLVGDVAAFCILILIALI